MGLDMYFYATNNKNITEEDLNKGERTDELKEVYYFRKHPNLHGQIQEYYFDKNEFEDIFNTTYYELSEEECKEILEKAKENSLPKTQGFFFGESTEDDNKRTVECMEMLIKLINDGHKVFYYAWW